MRTICADRLFEWSHGKTYSVTGPVLHTIPTNWDSVNHLDLEEHAISCCDVSRDAFLGTTDSPHVDLPGDRYVESCLRAKGIGSVREVADRSLKRIRTVMQKHYEIATLKSLSVRWDSDQYSRLVREFLVPSMLRGRRGQKTAQYYRLYLQTAFVGSRDNPSAAVSAISDIAKRAIELYGHPLMTTYEHVLFRTHTEMAGIPYERFRAIVPHQDLLFNAFLSGDALLMRLGLELEWKSGYLAPISGCLAWMVTGEELPGDVVAVDPSRWPRGQDSRNPICVESYHSLTFYAGFSHLAVWTAIRTGLDPSFVELFRLLWRAIPTPHLPVAVADMQKGVDFERVMQGFLPDSINRDIIEPRVYALLAEALDQKDSSAQFRPRTLKHLSRYALRRRVRSPEKIDRLNMPSSLRDYLLLDS